MRFATRIFTSRAGIHSIRTSAGRKQGYMLITFLLVIAAPVFADDTSQEISKAERGKLEKQAAALDAEVERLHAGGRFTDAVQRAEQSLAIRRRLYPPAKFADGHHDLANSLDNLAYELDSLGQPAKALPYCQQALAMRQKLYPLARFITGHRDIATSLDNMGRILVSLGHQAEALPYYEQALAMNQKLYPSSQYPEGHPELAESLNNLALLMISLGQPDRALPHLEQALAMKQKLYPPARFPDGHPNLAAGLANLANVLSSLGRLAMALSYDEQALAMRQKLYPSARFPDGHPLLAQSLFNAGVGLLNVSQPTKALPYCEQALAMDQRLYPPARFPGGHPDVAMCLKGVATVLASLGQPAKELPYCEQALAMDQKLYPPSRFPQGHPNLVASLDTLSGVLRRLGQPSKALPYCEQALAMNQKLYPPARFPEGHPDLAQSLIVLGQVLDSLGQPAKALPYCQRALAMNQKLYSPGRFPEGSDALARSLNALGVVLDSLGQPANALPYLEQALAMYQRLYPPARFPEGHARVALSFGSLAAVRYSLGQPAKALSNFERALTMYQKIYRPDRFTQGHPYLAWNLSKLGLVLDSLGQPVKALPYYERSLAMHDALAGNVFQDAAEAESLDFLRMQPLCRDALISVSCRTPLRDKTLYARLWAGRSAVSHILGRRHQAFVAAAERPPVRERWDELTDVRRQLARLLLNPLPDTKMLDEQARTLSARKERLERELASKLPILAEAQALDRLGPEDLQSSLPERAGFVDILRYGLLHFDPQVPGKSGERRAMHYVAFVLTRQKICRVELGEAAGIESALSDWRRAIADRKSSQAAEVLRRRLWEPIARNLPAGTDLLYIAPDGVLAELPWAALPGDHSDTSLVERYTFAVVPHGRYLLARLRDQMKPDPAGVFLAVGGIQYDARPAFGTKTSVTGLAAGLPPDRDGAPNRWSYLKATEREVEEVAYLAGVNAQSLSGAEASTSRLMQELPKARVAHLATHGFFSQNAFQEEKHREAALLKDWQFQAGHTTGEVGLGARNPLAFAGLVLAGANRPAEAGPDGGILTGEAIINLRLDKMHLAVLSACQTGLGAESDGECMHSLQHAFHVAGCKNVVASLWNVPDESTAALMAVFYHELLRNGRTPLEALHQAQLYVYRHPEQIPTLARTRGPDFDKVVRLSADEAKARPAASAHADIKLWAGFVLSGLGQ
jgi:CHAT domain-containing protein/tetratricopeptide (TPR) repeat protein